MRLMESHTYWHSIGPPHTCSRHHSIRFQIEQYLGYHQDQQRTAASASNLASYLSTVGRYLVIHWVPPVLLDVNKYKELVLAVVTHDGPALQHASEDLRDDYEIVKAAVRNDGLALQYASWSLRGNYYIVKFAVINNGMALQYTDKFLCDNTCIVAAAQEASLAIANARRGACCRCYRACYRWQSSI